MAFFNSSVPWEILLELLGHHQYLDPKTLGISCCVSKSWNSVLSSDHLWAPLCLSHYPSIANYSATVDGFSVSPRRLFALLRTSSNRKRRVPMSPRIALLDLIFAFDIFCDEKPAFSLAVSGDALAEDANGLFRFDVRVGEGGGLVMVDKEKDLRVVWNVLTKGFGGAFSMMDGVLMRGGLVGGEEMWFSEELPGHACCSRAASRGWGGGCVVAELGLGLGFGGGDQEEETRRVERVRFGLMSAREWRYLDVDDGLLFLQPFLLTSH